MKVDKFTKVILTVIAVNLTILTVKNINLVPKAYADEPTSNAEANPNMKYGLVPLNEDGTISVKLSNTDEIDVNIVGVDTDDEMDINIDEVGGKYISYGVPIPVKMD